MSDRTILGEPAGLGSLLEHPGGMAPRFKELGEFLRARREQLQPADVGLTPGRRRRTPGLRRDEVSALAGIGAAWYARLEAGHDQPPSTKTLLAIAHVLRFTADETEYLFELAGMPVPRMPSLVSSMLPEPIEELVPAIERVGAVVWDRFLTPLRWNAIGGALFGHAPDASPIERNSLVRMYDAHSVTFFADDYHSMLRAAVGMFRRSYTPQATPYERRLFETLIEYPLFKRYWNEHHVAVETTAGSGPFRRVHPVVGALSVLTTDLQLTRRSGWLLRIVVPADEATAEKFRRLETLGEPSTRATELPSDLPAAPLR